MTPPWGLLEPRTCSHPWPRRFSEVCPRGRPPGAPSRQCPAPGAVLLWDSPLWELAYVTGKGRPGTCVLKTALYPLGRGGPPGLRPPRAYAAVCPRAHALTPLAGGRAQAPGVTARMKRVPEREQEQPRACVPSGALAVGVTAACGPWCFQSGEACVCWGQGLGLGLTGTTFAPAG